jgi:hypothetical protein
MDLNVCQGTESDLIGFQKGNTYDQSILLQVLRQFFPVNQGFDPGFLFCKSKQASPAG